MSAPDPKCEKCEGLGISLSEVHEQNPPSFVRCECVLKFDILENVERGMKGLSKAPVVRSSPLLGKLDKSLFISAGSEFMAHLRHVSIRMPTTWVFKVVSDAELVTAWLASVALNGQDILDPDAALISTRFLTIPDLVVPPDLVVIRMGVKVARNSAASEVLAEALNCRMHENKPTWIWDDPAYPLVPGHLFWSDAVGRSIGDWTRLKGLDSGDPTPTTTPSKRSSVSTPPAKKSLRGGQ